MNGAIYALRLKLSDFLNDTLEHLVVEKIHEIYKVHTFKLQLWYDEGEVKPADLKSFMEKYESLLHYKTTIRPNRERDFAQFTWYNIVHKDDHDIKYPCRFQYEHNSGWKPGGVLNGLDQFREALKFVTSPKPSRQEKPKRKQKRNDYED
jgi:hypothetical protein|tara:strand:- start:94 stop:543 length:450 start_codon:yes stop_codon:yes gene_type:complete